MGETRLKAYLPQGELTSLRIVSKILRHEILSLYPQLIIHEIIKSQGRQAANIFNLFSIILDILFYLLLQLFFAAANSHICLTFC